MKRCIAVILVLVAATSIAAQQAAQEVSNDTDTVRLTIDPIDGTVADPISLVLEIETTPDSLVTWPILDEADLPNLTVSAEAHVPLEFIDTRVVRHTRRYTLEPYLPGPRTIAGIEIVITTPGDIARTLVTEPVEIDIVSLIDAEEENPPLAAPRTVVPYDPPGQSRTPLWLIIVPAIAAAAVTSLAVALLVRRRRPPADAAPSASERLATSLADLRARLDEPMPDVNECLSLLTGIIRLHIESRTHTDVTHHTADDLIAQLADGTLSLPPAHTYTMTRTLTQLDAARFGASAPNTAFVRQLFEPLASLVDEHPVTPEATP